MIETIIRKLTSRKFLSGASLIVSGLLLVFGFADSTAETIAGAVMAIGGAIGYMLAEAKVDAKNVGALVEAAQDIINALLPDEEQGEAVETENTEKGGE